MLMKNEDEYGGTSQDSMEEVGNCIDEETNQPLSASLSSIPSTEVVVNGNSIDGIVATPTSLVQNGLTADFYRMAVLSSAKSAKKGKNSSTDKRRERRRRQHKGVIAGLLFLMAILIAIVIAVRIATKALIKNMKSYNNSSIPIPEENEDVVESTASGDDSLESITSPSIDEGHPNSNENTAAPATSSSDSPGSVHTPPHTESGINQDKKEEVVVNEDSIEVLSFATPANNIVSSLSIPTPAYSMGSDLNPDTGEEVAVNAHSVDAISTVSSATEVTAMSIENEAAPTNVIDDNSNDGISTSIILTTNNKRNVQWLQAHNYRRKQWHQRSGVSYVPLRWSSGLASHAFAWAKQLIHTEYENIALHHEEDVEEGENLAMNCGTGSWGEMYKPDDVVERWVEEEENLLPPNNLHLTQVLWRATTYIGCADSKRVYDNGITCHIQVCRYVKMGNCNMGHYNDTEWMIPMLLDDSVCGMDCPPEGCF